MKKNVVSLTLVVSIIISMLIGTMPVYAYESFSMPEDENQEIMWDGEEDTEPTDDQDEDDVNEADETEKTDENHDDAENNETDEPESEVAEEDYFSEYEAVDSSPDIEIETVSEDSPSFEAMAVWNPSMPLPLRTLTSSELSAWQQRYTQNGGISQIEQEILRLVNIERAKVGAPSLGINSKLFQAARFKSQEMADLQYFDHNSPVYGYFIGIISLFTSTYHDLGENIYWGTGYAASAAFIVSAWMSSPGHRANILDPDFKSMGAGYMYPFATQMFSSEAPNSSVPPQTPNNSAIEQFVTRLYKNVLGRNPDAAGLQYWSNQLKNGATGASVARGFFFSSEFINRKTSNTTFVDILYRTLLDRAPDAGGRTYWVNLLNSGLPREDIFAGFVNSAEFSGLCNKAGIIRGTYTPPAGGKTRVFVTRLYKEALGRAPDQGGLDYWTKMLLSGKSTGTSVARGFVFSKEMANRKLSNASFIEVLYRTMMGRTYDVSGKAYWVNRLNNGASRQSVFNGFANSKEFDQICKTHGIQR